MIVGRLKRFFDVFHQAFLPRKKVRLNGLPSVFIGMSRTSLKQESAEVEPCVADPFKCLECNVLKDKFGARALGLAYIVVLEG